MSSVIQKATKERAIEVLDYFEHLSLDSYGSRDLIEILAEVLRDGCQGYANSSDEQILNMLRGNIMDDSSLEDQDEEFQEQHEELKEVIDLIEADLAIAKIVENKEA